jgi:hemerythrin
MTAQVAWTDDLLINVPAIDDDHKKLFALMSDIFASATHGSEAINRAIGALSKYTKEHFSREEESMAKTNYPGLSKQQYEHEHLVFQLDTLIERLMVSGPDAVDAGLAQFLMSWLGDHIMDFDLKYAEYLKANNLVG